MVKRCAKVRFVGKVCIVLTIVGASVRGDERNPDEARLPKALDKFVNQELEPAYASGNPLVMLETLRKQLPRLRETQIEQIDVVLEGRGLPTIAGMLGEAHLGAFEANVDSTKDMSLDEARIAIRHTRDEIDRLLREVRAIRLMKDPLPKPESLNEFRDLLWAASIQNNELLDMKDRIRLGELLTQRFSAKARRNVALEQQDILNTDFVPYQEQVDSLLQDLIERSLELRAERLLFAVTTLLGENDVKKRLAAAGVLATDRDEVIQLIKSGKGEFRRNMLNEQTLLDQLEINVRKGAESAGDLTQKSKLLFGGLHWWLRGRYGRGVQFAGLLKADQAKRDPAARNEIYMPKELPTKQTMQLTSSYAYPDRRHFYAWMWEERTLMVRIVSGSSTQVVPSPGENKPTRQLVMINGKPVPLNYQKPATLINRQPVTSIKRQPAKRAHRIAPSGGGRTGSISTGGGLRGATRLHTIGTYERAFWTADDLYKRLDYEPLKTIKPTTPTNQTPTRQLNPNRPSTNQSPTQSQPKYIQTFIPPLDPATIYQLVGFTEYGQALQYFDELLTLCNAEELKAISELISEEDEFAVEVNLSRTVEQHSSLAEQPREARDDFQRRGLDWVMALARVEVAAMLVGFADLDDAFTRLATPYDLDAYKEILADGMRGHYWSLTKDPQLGLILAGKADANRTLAYSRRVQVAEAMLKAAAYLTQQQLTQTQQAELKAWQLNLDKTRAVLAKRITDYHKS